MCIILQSLGNHCIVEKINCESYKLHRRASSHIFRAELFIIFLLKDQGTGWGPASVWSLWWGWSCLVTPGCWVFPAGECLRPGTEWCVTIEWWPVMILLYTDRSNSVDTVKTMTGAPVVTMSLSTWTEPAILLLWYLKWRQKRFSNTFQCSLQIF